jgi:hypothetical protein
MVTTKDTRIEVNAYKTKYTGPVPSTGYKTKYQYKGSSSSENVLGSTHFETILHTKTISLHVILRPAFKYMESCCVSVNLEGKKFHQQQSKILLNPQKDL